MSTIIRLFSALALLSVAGLAACADDGATDDGNRSETVDVGVLLPLTGPLQVPGTGAETTLLVAQAAINAAGGVLGRPLRFVVRDTGADPAKGRAAAIELMDEQGIELLIGAFSSPVTAAVLEETESRGALLLNSSSASPEINRTGSGGLFFRTTVLPTQLYEKAAQRLHAAGHRKVAMFVLQSPLTTAMAAVFKNAFESLDCGAQSCATMQWTYPEGVDVGSYDWATPMAEALAMEPDVIYVMGFVEDSVAVLQQSLSAGYDGPIQTRGSEAAPGAGELVAVEIKRRITWLGDAVSDGPALDAFLADFGDRPGPPVGAIYDAAFVLALAIEAAGDTEAAAVANAVPTIANSPGMTVSAGDYGTALSALAAGQAIDYLGINRIEFDSLGELIPSGFIEFTYDAAGEIVEEGLM